MLPQYILGLLFLTNGLLLIGVSLPLVRSRVPRNYVYGFRTPKTLSSDTVWYAANRYAGRALFWAGLAISAGSLVLLPISGFLSVDAVAYLGLALTLPSVGIALVQSFRYLRRL